MGWNGFRRGRCHLIGREVATVVDPQVAFGDEEEGVAVEDFFINREMAEAFDVRRGVVFIDPVFVEVPCGFPGEFRLEGRDTLGEPGGLGFVAEAVAVEIDLVPGGGDDLRHGLAGFEEPQGEVVVASMGFECGFPLIHDAKHGLHVEAKIPAGRIAFYQIGERRNPEPVGRPTALSEVGLIQGEDTLFEAFELAHIFRPAADFLAIAKGVGHAVQERDLKLDTVVLGRAGGGEPSGELGGKIGGDLGVCGQEVSLFRGIGVNVEELDRFASKGEEFPSVVAHDLGRVGFGFGVVALDAAVEIHLPEDRGPVPRGRSGGGGEMRE